jgi:hypothetical protein
MVVEVSEEIIRSIMKGGKVSSVSEIRVTILSHHSPKKAEESPKAKIKTIDNSEPTIAIINVYVVPNTTRAKISLPIQSVPNQNSEFGATFNWGRWWCMNSGFRKNKV